jgi:eukaryotic-like serine/threonine-protein kinase
VLVAEAFQPPAEFDDYVVLQQLGSGTMGMVFLAEDTVLARHVAVKFIAGVEPDLAARQRFLAEARAAARIQHPNVASIYRVGELGHHPYIITEFVRGKSLADMPKPLPWTEVLTIGLDLARGLAAAHRKGVVHCDIKSANVMITDEGTAKLVDFGMATLVQEGSGGDESSTSISGTPDFMAPEVWAGKAPTRRCDVYSVGAVLFELCAGKTPFADIPPDRLQKTVLETDATPLAQVVPDVDPRLAVIVDRCLCRDPADRFAGGDELREALEELSRNATSAALPAGNPYRGLRAFEADHRALFFGRSAEIGAILDRLRTEPFLLVTGDSGVGKSSICRAGVLPAIIDGALGGRSYTVVTMTPGRHPLRALAAAVGGDETRAAADPAGLARELHRRLGPNAGLVLFIDQLEEVLTISNEAEAAAFEDALADLADGIPGVRVVATLRADFLARFAALPRLGQDLSRFLYFLRPLPRERIREVIAGPAHATGIAFESEAMVDALVAATAQAEGGLPLLQFALAELWEARDTKRNVIPAAALEAMGGVAGALARHADAVLAAMPPSQRALARRLFTRLVSASGTRARRTDVELGAGDPAVRATLDALVSGRLLVAHDADGGSAYELAHEVLLHGWGRLRNWLAEDAEGRVLRERITTAAGEWEQLNRPGDALWNARRLAETEGLDLADLPPAQRAFLAASRRAARKRRWGRWGMVSGVILLVVSVYAGLRIATRREIDREVNSLLSEARTSLAGALQARALGDQNGAAAMAHFDRGQRPDGENAWAEAIVARSDSERRYGETSRLLEAALAKDNERDDARELMGDVLYERALLAEADRRNDVRDELVQRFTLYDADGSRLRRWNASAPINIKSEPKAQITLEPSGELLGDTPLSKTLPRGLHILGFRALGRADVRAVILVERGHPLAVAVDLPDAARVPDGFVVIPAGRFLFGAAGDEDSRRFFDTVPVHEVATAPYLIGRTEVTYQEWLAYVATLDPNERALRTPGVATKVGASGALRVEHTARGWHLSLKPLDRTYEADWGQTLRYFERADHASADWRRLPVTGISAEDAEAYASWLRQTGRVQGARLCTEQEWERAARGADDRIYPHGNDIRPGDATFDQTYGPDLMGPDEVGSHPASRSPFGLDDMAGNAFEWTTSSLVAGAYVARGGSYFHDRKTIQVINRNVSSPALRDLTLGVRICAAFPR